MTSTNSREREVPTIVVWGSNHAGATTLRVEGVDLSGRYGLPISDYFAVAFEYDERSDAADDEFINGLSFTFSDTEGSDLSSEFRLVR